MIKSLATLTLVVAASQAGLAQAQTDTQALINRVEVRPINAGINPNFAGYEITAIVVQGFNQCEALAQTPSLQARVDDSYIHVTAFLNQGAHTQACSSAPQRYYSKVTTQVIFDTNKVTDTLIYNYRNGGNVVSLGQALTDSAKAQIKSFSTRAIRSAYPNQTDLIVTVSVMTGANPCAARNSTVTFEQQVIDGKLVVRAPVKTKPVVCTMELNPQYETRQFRLVAVKNRYSDIVLENVGDDGADASLLGTSR